MKIFLILLTAVFTGSFANAQTNFTISGKVTNEVTGTPMPAASVFAQNTTFGTATDAEGNFSLTLPLGGYDLAITYTGYRTESRRITISDASEKINITLKEKEKELEVVAITSSNEVADGWVKYGSLFNNEFIGYQVDSNLCRIQNPEVLHFFFSKRKNRIRVTATEPLMITNNILGYNIRYTLDSFSHEFTTEVSAYTGYPLFEELPGSDDQKQQWEVARHAAYKGSILQFMRSIYNKNMKTQQFEIQFIVKTNGKDDAVKLKDPYAALNYQKDDSTQTVEILPNQNNVVVLYSGEKPVASYLKENAGEPSAFQFSTLSFKPNESIVIEQNGYYYDQSDISISGYWTWDKVAHQLPYNYHFLQE